MIRRGEKLIVVACPPLSREGTVTVDPSENVIRPAVTWSEPFGRSYKTILLAVTADDQERFNHAPAFSPREAHSDPGFAGYPEITPSTAAAAPCPVANEEELAVAWRARFVAVLDAAVLELVVDLVELVVVLLVVVDVVEVVALVVLAVELPLPELYTCISLRPIFDV